MLTTDWKMSAGKGKQSDNEDALNNFNVGPNDLQYLDGGNTEKLGMFRARNQLHSVRSLVCAACVFCKRCMYIDRYRARLLA